MGEHGVQRLLTWAWALLVVSSALYFLGDHEADNDLWMHLYSGQRIVAESAVPRKHGVPRLQPTCGSRGTCGGSAPPTIDP